MRPLCNWGSSGLLGPPCRCSSIFQQVVVPTKATIAQLSSIRGVGKVLLFALQLQIPRHAKDRKDSREARGWWGVWFALVGGGIGEEDSAHLMRAPELGIFGARGSR